VLIFISDLHFTDETVGMHNIPLRAFEGVFEDIRDYSDTPTEIKIIFLGDVFDLLRTTYWLDVPESERPWGDRESKSPLIEAHANMIMNAIVKKNSSVFGFLNDGLEKFFGQKVEKIYIPGNHDRLCNIYNSLRKKVRSTLGIPGDREAFPHVYDDMLFGNKYKVFARHGHELDKWNYDGSTNWNDTDYEQVPIGDLIATEIISRIPHTIMQNIGNSIPEDQKDELKRNLQEVDNVRPFSAILEWMFYQVNQNPDLSEVIDKSLADITSNFQSLQYPKRLYKKHDNLLKVEDADEVQGLIELFKNFNITAAEALIPIFSRILGSGRFASSDDSDKDLTEGAADFLTLSPNYRSIVMGHTHNPLQIPIGVTSDGLDQIYINTGTWRKRYIQGTNSGFIGLKYLTYAVFYTGDEKPHQFFETWTGTLKEEGK
jgi:UDP-2,3-diacylglucosamine pyrophosphatase LpxH